MLIDTHCHLHHCINTDFKKILLESKKAGVDAFIASSAKPSDVVPILELTKAKNIFATLGVHPFYADESFDISSLAQYLNHPKIVAIGEIGLDFSKKHQVSIASQTALLEKQLALALDFQKSVVLHCVGKGASLVLFKALKKFKVQGGVLHGFSGSFETAQNFLKLGFKIGFNGNLLKSHFKRVQFLAQKLPADSLLLESDFPFASFPTDLPKILMVLAQLRQSCPESLENQIHQNTLEVFHCLFPQ